MIKLTGIDWSDFNAGSESKKKVFWVARFVGCASVVKKEFNKFKPRTPTWVEKALGTKLWLKFKNVAVVPAMLQSLGPTEASATMRLTSGIRRDDLQVAERIGEAFKGYEEGG
jgi:hypothetical protein